MGAGYCKRLRLRRLHGTLGPFEYVFSDDPVGIAEQRTNSPRPEKPDVAEPDVAEPDLANPYTTNKERDENIGYESVVQKDPSLEERRGPVAHALRAKAGLQASGGPSSDHQLPDALSHQERNGAPAPIAAQGQ